MSDDAVLSIRTTFDGSSLKSGMESSASVVTQGSAEMVAALKGVSSANADLAASISKAISIRASERAASAEAAAASRAAALARREEAAQIKDATHAAHLFGFETGIEIPRALRSVLAHTQGAQQALSMMFPMMVAAGFIEILFRTGKEVYEWGKAGYEAAEKITQGFNDLSRKEKESNDEIAVTNARLEQEIDKLEKKPNNGLALALAEAAVAADKLADHLRSALDESAKLLKSQQVGAFKGAVLGLASTGPAADLVKQLQDEMSKAEGQRTWALGQASLLGGGKAQQDAITKANQDFAAEQLRIATEGRDKAKKLADEAQAAQTRATAAAARGPLMINPHPIEENQANALDYGARISAFRGIQGELGAAVTGMQGSQDTEALQKKKGVLEQQKELGREQAAAQRTALEQQKQAHEADRHAAEAEVQAAKNHLEEMKAVHSMSAFEEAGYWANLAHAAKAGSLQKREEYHLAARADAEGEKELERIQDQITKMLAEQAEKRVKAEAELAKAIQEGIAIRRQNAGALEEEQIKADLAAGKITALGSAQKEAALHAQELTDKLAALQVELSGIQATPTTDKFTPEQKSVAVQQAQNKIDQASGQGKVQAKQDQAKITQELAAPYQHAAQLITTSFSSGINSWIEGSKRFGAAMQQTWRSIAMGAIENIEKIGQKWIQNEILMMAKHQASTTANVATDAAGAASSTAIDKTAKTSQGLGAAKLAFKNTYSQVSGWPFVGPILAPILAGAAFATVAAFEQGGIAGAGQRYGTAVPVIAHAGERILTTQQTHNFENMVNNRNSNAHLTVDARSSYHGMTDRQMRSWVESNPRATVKAMRNGIRRLGLYGA